MPGRIDLDGEGSGGLEEAMRELERRQKRRAARGQGPAEPAEEGDQERDEARRRFLRQREQAHRRAREDISEAIDRIRVEQRAARAAQRRRPWARAVAYGLLGLMVVAGTVLAALALRPEPPPPVASSPQEAVRLFWQALIEGRHTHAASYCPGLVDRYGSVAQAAHRLASHYRANPPARIVAIGEPEELPDGEGLRVSYEVRLRDGRPHVGEVIVSPSADRERGFLILYGP